MPGDELEQRIRERAFFLWIEQGRPDGRDRDHWRQAESELMAGTAAPERCVKPAPGEATQAEPARPHIQVAPGGRGDRSDSICRRARPRSGRHQ
ncbi:DUF2934 domain-containing protein [Rhodoplanes sp. Z2-YC6860]|uniref:DUF2934 domain-containing protein n=1 Tax=Rhodoplanes sp. Z2-YC6860 TaxID=674703 RepID=UPI00078D091D|nr:hypothetical protein RHPLAN_47500 [Rhodoplanes sp. Z2-YC6860]